MDNKNSTYLRRLKVTVDNIYEKLTESGSSDSGIAGCPAPSLSSISAESASGGIDVTYKARVSQGEATDSKYWLMSQTKGVMARYSSTGFPVSHTDGELGFTDEDLFTVNGEGVISPKEKTNKITGLDRRVEYYISLFPYTKDGVYNEILNQGEGFNNTVKAKYVGVPGSVTVTIAKNNEFGTLGGVKVTLTPKFEAETKTGSRTGVGDIVISDVEPGEYTLSYGDTEGFTAPSSADVTVNDAQDTKVTGTYTVTAGAITINVSRDKNYANLGSVTATLTPTFAGAENRTGTRSGDGSISIEMITPGTYNLTVNAQSNFSTPSSQQVTIVGGTTKSANVVYNFSAPAFSSASWSVIDAVSRGGDASTYWAVGNTKDISISGETLTFEVVGFNHDDLQSGGKAGITLGMKHLMKDTRQMNGSSTNSGSFVGSNMYRYLNGTFYNGMPSDLRSVIKSVNKVTGNGGGSSSGTRTDAMKIFLFSEQEVFGSKSYSVGNEGSQYSRFTTSSTRIKKLSNGSGSARSWWLRSPRSGYSDDFCRVLSGGAANYSDADVSYGVCAGFCV